MFDFGIGNGLRNRLAKALALGEENKIRTYLSSAYILLGMISTVLVVLVCLITPHVDWQEILKTNIEPSVINLVILVVLIGIILQFFFKLVTSILYALQKNVLANSIAIFTNILIMSYLMTGTKGDDYQKIINLAYVYDVAVLFPLICTSIYVFTGPLKGAFPTYKAFQKRASIEVFSIGGLFFLVQLGLLVVNSTNQFLVNFYFGGGDVVQYTVYYRLYGTATMLLTLFTQPIWSEISVRYAKGDIGWIRTIYHVMLGIAALITIGSLGVSFLLPWIFGVWLGNSGEVNADVGIGIIFTLWNLVELFIMASTCIANGMTKLKCQTVFTLIAAIAKLPVTFFLVHIYQNWTAVIIAHTAILTPLMIAQNLALKRIFSEELKKE